MDEQFNRDLQQVAGVQRLMENPFPGLRPFAPTESHLFFGREGQSDEVLMKLAKNRFCAIIGPSGSGKSSFVYCGVIPILHGGFLSGTSSNWKVIIVRPGDGPIRNLSQAILDNDPLYEQASDEEKPIRERITNTMLRSSSTGLTEAIGRVNHDDENVLLLVDQFEELFRFRKEDNRRVLNESLAFVNMLMEASKGGDKRIHVAITMRSDFIGECAHFPSLTQRINDSHYLIPQMTRDQKRMAVTGPVAVGGGQISPRLVQQLLNDLGDNPDQLPILQHSLMRTWDYWTKNRDGQEPMDLHHYESIGTMREALSQHANEAYDELNEEQKHYCEVMFKTLTEEGTEAGGVRRPSRVSEIASIAGCTNDQVIEIVEKFREPGRSLLMPAAGVPLDKNSIIDISHESLMRIWVRLKNWVEDEASSIKMYKRLAEAADLFQQGKGGLWRPPDLQLALNWKAKQKPTLVWAERHHPAFERTMVFLDTSQTEYEQEQRIKELQQKRAIRRARVTAIVLGTAAIISIGFLIFAVFQTQAARKAENEAAENLIVAEENAAEALRQKALAEEQREVAEKQQQIAQEQARIAEEQRAEAEKQQAIAEEQRQAATAAQARAEESAEQARIAQAEAERNAEEARRQEAAATAASNRAQRLRMLAIAKSMAVKSQQIQEEPQRQGLLAYQAYQYNAEYGGEETKYDPDIYAGLYYAYNELKGGDVNQYPGHDDLIHNSWYSADGESLVAISSDGNTYRYTAKDYESEPEVLYNTAHVVKDVVPSPSGDRVVLATEDKHLQIISTAGDSWSLERSIPVGTDPIEQIVMVPDGRSFYALTIRGKILKSDYSSLSAAKVQHDGATTLGISHDGNLLAVGLKNGTVAVYEQGAEEPTMYEVGSSRTVTAVTFSPDDKQLVVGNLRGTVYTLDVATGDLDASLQGHRSTVVKIVFSPDGKRMATASRDNTARLYDTDKINDEPTQLRDHDDWVTSLTFSPDSRWLTTGTKSGTVKEWPTDSKDFATAMCSLLQRNMTQKEWNLYVDTDIDYENTCSGLPKP